jgi:hypothetical protein
VNGKVGWAKPLLTALAAPCSRTGQRKRAARGSFCALPERSAQRAPNTGPLARAPAREHAQLVVLQIDTSGAFDTRGAS